MKTIKVANLREFLENLAGEMDAGEWGFRGVPSSDYDLIPSIGRKDVRKKYDPDLEKRAYSKGNQTAFPRRSLSDILVEQ